MVSFSTLGKVGDPRLVNGRAKDVEDVQDVEEIHLDLVDVLDILDNLSLYRLTLVRMLSRRPRV